MTLVTCLAIQHMNVWLAEHFNKNKEVRNIKGFYTTFYFNLLHIKPWLFCLLSYKP